MFIFSASNAYIVWIIDCTFLSNEQHSRDFATCFDVFVDMGHEMLRVQRMESGLWKSMWPATCPRQLLWLHENRDNNIHGLLQEHSKIFNDHFAHLRQQSNDRLQPRVPILRDGRRSQSPMLLRHGPVQRCMALRFCNCSSSTYHHLIRLDYVLEHSLEIQFQTLFV
jgi:hypothetical protein